ncbi:hypothetical protein [Kitasatospora sp. NBC_00458]|uniref:hypothetical protein n=1 Tax=Kitasatospora sp. NBC_00458 TaxID=2903568 RepID=UPI002E17CF9F
MSPSPELARPWLRPGEELSGLVEVRLSWAVGRAPRRHRERGADVEAGVEGAFGVLDLLLDGAQGVAGLALLYGARAVAPGLTGGWESLAGRFAAAAREAEPERSSATFGYVLLAFTDRRRLLLKRRGALRADHLVDPGRIVGVDRIRPHGRDVPAGGDERWVRLRFADGSAVAVRVARGELKALEGLTALDSWV